MPDPCGNSDVDLGHTFMYSLPVILLTLSTALNPAETRSGRPLSYPGTHVKQSVSSRPCLMNSPVDSVWLVATGVNGFFVATAYVKVGFVVSLFGGICISTELCWPFVPMTLLVAVTMQLVNELRMSPIW